MTSYLGGSSRVVVLGVTVPPAPLSLDALAANPALATAVPPEIRQVLVLRAAAALAALAAGSVTGSPEQPAVASASTGSSEGEWLDSDGVQRVFSLDARWLADHAGELRRLRIVSAPSRKVRLYHRGRLARLLDSRTT